MKYFGIFIPYFCHQSESIGIIFQKGIESTLFTFIAKLKKLINNYGYGRKKLLVTPLQMRRPRLAVHTRTAYKTQHYLHRLE